MSIEPSQFDISFEMSSKDFNVFRFATDGSIAGKVDNQELLDRASGALNIWRSVQGIYDVEFAILRGEGRFTAIYARGGVILESYKPANVGLVRKSLQERAPVAIQRSNDVDTAGFSPTRRVVWTILEKFARVEAPRMFDFSVGAQQFQISVTRDGFGFVDDSNDIDAFLSAIATAVETGATIDFGFEPYRPHAGTTYGLGDLFRSDASSWFVDHQGWQRSCQGALQADEIKAISALAQVTAGAHVSRAEFFAGSGERKLTLAQTGEGFDVTRAANARPTHSQDL